jgi:hypothetical protein
MNEIKDIYGYLNIKKIMEKYKNDYITPKLLGIIFEHITNSEKNEGYTDMISVSSLIDIHKNFKTNNGGNWCRTNVSYLGRKYVIKRIRKGINIESIQLNGFNKKVCEKYRTINKKIINELKNKRCVFLDVVTSDMEIDHKNARYNEFNDTKNQSIESFQPTSKAANDAKRQHCKICRETGKRYDATKLGFFYSFIKGDIDSDYCDGCYWYDPIEFRNKISKNFVS